MKTSGKGEIVFTKYSPYSVIDVAIEGPDGMPLEGPRVISLCRCGKSQSMPRCDGTHAAIGFSGERRESDTRGTRDYAGPSIIIHDNRYLCSHDGACINLLPSVFNLDRRPWIDPDGSPVERIIEVIRRCPSGALTYTFRGERHDAFFAEQRVVAERGGPLRCQGGIDIKDDQESDLLLGNRDHCALCRCGESRHRPFCDGTHVSNGFES